ncbi:MAG: hypothetical protein EZS28_015951 [Streblomastix strix]|uniref:Uncharacterized protein n=1 Tax=Streblomastix strix TaxID=222440 RepID=A0A5J4W231_9EUKA|nr:MAG: hypothetical protein EZS28_015951 [Streblomastix strix]
MGSIFFDFSSDDTSYKYVNVTDIPLLDPRNDEKLASFRLFSENEFESLEVKSTAFNYKQCSIIEDAIVNSYYILLGLVAYLREKVNIAPSITYSIEVLPTEVKYQISDSQNEDYLTPRGCSGNSYQYFLGSELGGIVSSECISNDATQFPDYSGGTSTTVPPKPIKCDDGTADVKQYAKGLKFGYIKDASNDELKQILSRVGPIRGVINYYKDDDILDRDESILFGCNQDQWIIVRQYIEPNIEYDEVTLYIEERIPFIHADGGTNSKITGDVFYYNCRYPTSETSSSICECPEELNILSNDAIKDTICVIDCNKKTIDTPEDVCPCPDKKDKASLKTVPRTGDKATVVLPDFALVL